MHDIYTEAEARGGGGRVCRNETIGCCYCFNNGPVDCGHIIYNEAERGRQMQKSQKRQVQVAGLCSFLNENERRISTIYKLQAPKFAGPQEARRQLSRELPSEKVRAP
jgi:hypothetical protein